MFRVEFPSRLRSRLDGEDHALSRAANHRRRNGKVEWQRRPLCQNRGRFKGRESWQPGNLCPRSECLAARQIGTRIEAHPVRRSDRNPRVIPALNQRQAPQDLPAMGLSPSRWRTNRRTTPIRCHADRRGQKHSGAIDQRFACSAAEYWAPNSFPTRHSFAQSTDRRRS